MDNNPSIPKLPDLLDNHAAATARNLFCALPGEIDSYDAENTTATIVIQMKRVNDLTGEVRAYAGLVDVPVLQLSGGDAGINMPIAVGDPCLVVFADRDIDNWFSTGSAQAPNSNRAHSLADGFAIVGFRPLTHLADRPDYLAAGIYRDKTQISIKGNKVAVKNSTKDLYTLLQNFCDAVVNALGTATPSVASVQAGGTPLTVSFTTTAIATAKADLDNLLYHGDETTP
jgi:hypothetical protein